MAWRNKIAKSTRDRVFNMFNGRCAYCGNKLTPRTFECDHIVPFMDGGRTKNNLFPCCNVCNGAKGFKSIEQFRHYLENEIFNQPGVKLIDRYYVIEPQEIVFYFEQVGFDVEGMIEGIV